MMVDVENSSNNNLSKDEEIQLAYQKEEEANIFRKFIDGEPLDMEKLFCQKEEQPTRSAISDKIPSHHSDLIISMILSRSDELFADNRKRKPIFNARRKAKWKELVENLNQQLGMDYSVERVKNNYHYRVTSLKRNMNRHLNSVKENEDYISSPAYQQLSEIDRRLYETVRQSATEEAQSPAKRKKVKSEERDTPTVEIPTFSTEITSIDQIFENFHEEHADSGSETNDESMKKNYNVLLKSQTEMFQTLKSFMAQQTLQTAQMIEMMSSATTLLKEATTQIERASQPCPTCTGNILEKMLMAVKAESGD